jgi:hypothetical protein
MEQFYFELGQGLPPAEALQAAKNRLRADSRWNRPSLWSGYVLIGEAPAVVPRRVPWAVWIVEAVILGLTVSLLSRRKGRPGEEGRGGEGPGGGSSYST